MSGTPPRTPAATLPVPLLRDAVAREVAQLSLRRAAREIGVSPNGLRNFLNGAAPRMRTRGQLERWLGGRATSARPPTVGQLVRLLGKMGADLPPSQAAALSRDIAELLASAYQNRRLPPPRWVRELVAYYGDRRAKPR